MYELLATSTPALLFTVVGLGYFLGNIRIAGFSLGIAAVVFVGLAFGAIDPVRFVIPEVIYILGLILFVYIVGLQSGPVFFNVLRRQWLRLTILTAVTITIAGVLAHLAAKLLHISDPVASGLFCGALTNTPALAGAIEVLRHLVTGSMMDPAEARLLVDGPTVGYSIAYPFGVIGALLAMYLVGKIRHIDFKREEKRALKESGLATEEPHIREWRVTNPMIVGKTFGEAQLTDLTGLVFTRIKSGSRIELAAPELVLREGDILVGVGSDASFQKAELLIGPIVQEAVERLSPDIGYRDLVVIQRKAAGIDSQALSALLGFPVIVSRIRRGGVQITPTTETILEVGDQIRVVARHEDLDRVTSFVGDPMRDISEADYLSFSLGLVLGVAVGMIPIPLPGKMHFELGFAGGPLLVGLLLGWKGRTGPIVWTMPSNASFTLRQLGLLFFLAGVGTRAGGSFLQTFMNQGASLLLAGVVITTVTSLLTLFLARKVFRYDMVSTYGILAGIHTQPAALAYANAQVGSESANIPYAAVYPVALIAKIVVAQILVGL